VQRPKAESLEDKHVQRALDKVSIRIVQWETVQNRILPEKPTLRRYRWLHMIVKM
jgi:hypothetical protein